MSTTIVANPKQRDPWSPSVESETIVKLDYGEGLFSVAGKSRLSRGAVLLSTAVSVNRHDLFGKKWRWPHEQQFPTCGRNWGGCSGC